MPAEKSVNLTNSISLYIPFFSSPPKANLGTLWESGVLGWGRRRRFEKSTGKRRLFRDFIFYNFEKSSGKRP